MAGQEMKFRPPLLSDEEERSGHMPDYLLCDGCLAVVTQLQLALHAAHRHIGLASSLKSWDVIETLEETCQYKTFQ